MTQSATTPITAHAMLAEAQGYRTSLESLMEVGRSLLLQPSMEDSSASAYKVLAEGVLESADHQADLTVVDGVTEPAAVVELIMQDVLTPRLTDIEEIERALQAKADNEEPVPFTTRDAETAASMESIHHKVEVLEIFKDHVGDIKTIITSMEGLNVDVLRPMVLRLLERAGEGAVAMGISMESVSQTQVLGEMADAVDRIETLVNKAHEEAIAISDAARSESEGLGAGGEDKLGAVIESHRDDSAIGPQLAEGTSATTIDSGTEDTTGGTEAGVVSDDTVGDLTDLEDGDAGTLELEPVVPENSEEETGGADDTNVEEEQEEEEEPPLDTTGDDETLDTDLDDTTDDVELPAATDDVDLDDSTDDDNSSEEEEEKDDDEEEEEKDDSTASNESLNEAVVIDSMSRHTENQAERRDVVATLLDACSGLELLSEKGNAALTSGVDENFELTSDMFKPVTGDILTRHYETWAVAAIRDGGANVRALLALINN